MLLPKRTLVVIASSALTIGAATAATSPAEAQNIGSFNSGDITRVEVGGVNINVGSGDPSTGSRPEMAGVPDLTEGMAAPNIDVGSAEVEKGTVSYSNSIGSSDSFSVGASTNMGAAVSASSTPDYKVKSSASFGIGGRTGSTINQVIGSSVGGNSPDVPSGAITGEFNRAYTPDTLSNDVAVTGIGTDASITASRRSKFQTDIKKGRTKVKGELINTGAGSANGSASGSVGTTTTASANNSQFVSSFAQAY